MTGTIVPLVHVRVASALTGLAPSDLQVIPVQIEDQPDQFCILHLIRTINCIDDNASEFVEYYTAADGSAFENCVGEYKDVRGMRIDRTKVGSTRIFRPWGWHVAIIVSEEIKHALEQIRTVGVRFEEV